MKEPEFNNSDLEKRLSAFQSGPAPEPLKALVLGTLNWKAENINRKDSLLLKLAPTLATAAALLLCLTTWFQSRESKTPPTAKPGPESSNMEELMRSRFLGLKNGKACFLVTSGKENQILQLEEGASLYGMKIVALSERFAEFTGPNDQKQTLYYFQQSANAIN